MFEPILRTVAATLAAGTIALAITVAPAAKGHEPTQAQDTRPAQTSAKADRMRVRLWGNACSLRAWPNFEPRCQFDLREPIGEARTVRVIALR